jgi:hypothetical protein
MIKMWFGIVARGTVELLLSKSTCICDSGWERTRRRHPSTESPPTAITSASEQSTDSEVLSVNSRGLDTINTSLVFVDWDPCWKVL